MTHVILHPAAFTAVLEDLVLYQYEQLHKTNRGEQLRVSTLNLNDLVQVLTPLLPTCGTLGKFLNPYMLQFPLL